MDATAMPGCTPFQKPARATAKRWRGLRDTEVPDGCAALPGARPSPLDYKHQVAPSWQVGGGLGGQGAEGVGPRRSLGALAVEPRVPVPRASSLAGRLCFAASCEEVPAPQRRRSLLGACPIAPGACPIAPTLPVPLRRVSRDAAPGCLSRCVLLGRPPVRQGCLASVPVHAGAAGAGVRRRASAMLPHFWEEDGDDCTVGEAQRGCRQRGGV